MELIGKGKQFLVLQCSADSCLNGGTCLVMELIGKGKQFLVLQCSADSCLNGGTCRDGVNR